MLVYMVKSTQDEEMEICAQIGEECKNFKLLKKLSHDGPESWHV